jgi:hypothetical protein
MTPPADWRGRTYARVRGYRRRDGSRAGIRPSTSAAVTAPPAPVSEPAGGQLAQGADDERAARP